MDDMPLFSLITRTHTPLSAACKKIEVEVGRHK